MPIPTHRGSSETTDVTSRSTAALAGTLLLLGVGYVLLVAAPVFFQRSPAFVERLFASGTEPAWLPAAVAGGLVVIGAAALLYVLAQLVRDVERHPYACLAPVLAVFSAFVLVGLRAKSVVPGIASEHFAAIAMVVAVAGGALVKKPGVLNVITGGLIAFLPAATLLGLLWSASGKGDLFAVWSATDPQLRVFTALLTGSSFAMIAIGAVSRSVGLHGRVASKKRKSHAAEVDEDDAILWQQMRAQADAIQPNTQMALGAPQLSLQSQVDAYDIERLTWSGGFPAQAASRGTPAWLVAVLSLATVGAVGALGYRLYLRHLNEQQQAALAAQIEAERAAEQKRLADAQRAKEAEAAAARLEAMLAAPQASAEQPIHGESAAEGQAHAQGPSSSAPGPTQGAVAAVADEAVADEAVEEPAEPSASARDEARSERKHAARRRAKSRAKASKQAKQAKDEDALFAADDGATKKREERAAKARSLEDDVLALVGAERKKPEAKKPEPKLSYAERKKLREEQKKTQAAQRAVARTLDGNDDPIFGL